MPPNLRLDERKPVEDPLIVCRSILLDRRQIADVDAVEDPQRFMQAYSSESLRPALADVLAEDGPIRMMALRKYEPITLSKKKWHPIWDWSKTEVVDAIEHRSAEQLALVVVEALLDERQAGPLSERVRNA